MGSGIYGTHKPAGGDSDLFLKIKDGETVTVRIASEPAIFETENEDKVTQEIRISTKYGWIVYNQDRHLAQVWQQGAKFFRALAALAQDEEWGDPTGYNIKISRQGSGFQDTVYNVTPSTNRDPLDDAAKADIAKIDLIDILNKSPFSQRVGWLAEHEDVGTPASPVHQDQEPADEKPPVKPDVVIEDIGDKPINLDDIPF